MREPKYTIKLIDGTPVQEGDEVLVDRNLHATFVELASPPWGDDEAGEWQEALITVRYSWGATEDVKATRAGIYVDEV